MQGEQLVRIIDGLQKYEKECMYENSSNHIVSSLGIAQSHKFFSNRKQRLNQELTGAIWYRQTYIRRLECIRWC
jgi:hypothetical protein